MAIPDRIHDNRRAARRKHDSVLELYKEGRLITGIGRLVDFSSVGVCFSTTSSLAVGDRLNARLRLLQEGVLDIEARVIWARKKPSTFLYGIEFDSVRSLPRD